MKQDCLQTVLRAEIPVLYRVARRLRRNPQEAEDLVSRTLVQVASHWGRFDGLHPRSWMIKIMRNENAQELRRSSNRPSTSFDEIEEPAADDFCRATDWALVGEQLTEALESLPEDFRLPIVLCDVEGLSYEQASEALACPIGTIRSRIHRGRKLLRATLYHLGNEVGATVPL